MPIDLIMHTPGGIALAATQIAMALKAHPAKKTVIVPHYAMSGGTMIALAADEILMDPHAVIGPVDPQLANKDGQFAASSIIRAVKEKPIERISDATLMLADDAKKAQDQMIVFVREIMKGKCGEQNTDKIISELVMGKYTHDYPIFPEQAKELLGDCVNSRHSKVRLRADGLLQDGHGRTPPGCRVHPGRTAGRPAAAQVIIS